MNLKKPLAATACILIFGIATYLSYQLVADELAYIQRGVSAEGVVLKKRVETISRSGRSPSKSWYVAYEFDVDGRVLQNRSMLDMGRGYDEIKEGDPVAIVYDPENPEKSRTHLAAPWIRYPMVIFFIYAMGTVLAYVPIRTLRRSEFTTDHSMPNF